MTYRLDTAFASAGRALGFQRLIKSWLVVVIAATCLGSAANAASPPLPDGVLIERAACEPKSLTYEDWLDSQEEGYASEAELARAHQVSPRPFAALRPLLPTKEEFRTRRGDKGRVCERLTYASDGLKVVAYLWRPAKVNGKLLPLIIFNRGGGQDLGKLVPNERDGFVDFVKSGFVVIGSQYRGNDGGEGHDEEGGREVRDIINLVTLTRSLGYVDMRNVFMAGESRGAMMTFLAMQEGIHVNAAALIGSETDLAANLKGRPELLEGYRKDMPGFRTHPDTALRRRSALYWAEAISAPLLLMHGGNDWRVPPKQDLAFATRLDTLRKPFELVVFDGDTHLLPFHWRERDQRMIAWFKAHMIDPAADAAEHKP